MLSHLHERTQDCSSQHKDNKLS